ncbi:hypothetical protein PVAND_005680 [Polypedilum vanderplanki]|uniref:ABC transporter domain-containing protein n=1 Tax=Polypedilum vanderplanki TaxID=319348 RepID=A0A9J6C1P2_POLVA|nr:hypothetical protein PVAND_005680 [Polypedilum vanderplanki]
MWSHKFKLLLWKNWILVKRHPIAGLFEIVFPVLIVLIFTYSRGMVGSSKIPEVHYESFDTFPTQCSFGYSFKEDYIEKIGYAPETEFFTNIITNAIQNKESKSKLKIFPFKNEDELNIWIRNESATSPVAAVFFEEIDAITKNNNEISPKHLKYVIHMPQDSTTDSWFTDQIYYSSPSKRSRLSEHSSGVPNTPPYYGSCFLDIQNHIDRAFIKYLNSSATFPKLKMNAFPYPEIIEDIFMQFATQAFPVLFVLCMMLSIKNIIKNIAIERETLLKESMKMMGLSSMMHWISWLTKCFIMLIIPFTFNCILMTTTLASELPLFVNSNPILIWIFLVIYIFSVVTLCFLIAVCFEKSTNAANVGTLIFFIAIVPHIYFAEKFHAFPYILKAVYSMIPNSNMGLAVSILANSEATETGIGITTLFKRSVDLKFSFGEILIFMILGSIIQMFLATYIERVFPGEFGISDPFYYPVMPFIKFIKRQMGYDSLSNESVLQDRRISNQDYEEEPENLRAGVRIVNLSKKFGDKFVVDKLCLNMFEDQITVLLGHNGAGKTTTMNMLTGLFSPNGGTAYINGKDIRSELDEARVSLGICAQHNILFEELTVKEHLMFFCSLKGMIDKRLIAEEIRRYANLLGLKEKLDAQSKTLSGGMKRKLSIAIALCGDAKTVILDEPSSGMDPDARRSLWDLLIAEKKGRTILLSTHYLDEAEVLGDRIAIMTEGRLRTCGSSFYLKKKFGTGYRLTTVKKEGFQSIAIVNLLRKYSIDTHIESDEPTEAIFIISEENLPQFEYVFKDLEDNLEDLRISSFGCSLSTLEEVFLKLGIESSQKDKDHDEIDNYNRLNENDHQNLQLNNDDPCVTVSGSKLIFYQIEAMLLKKFHVFRRTWKTLLYVALFSVWMVVIVMSAPSINFNGTNELKISFEVYDETETVLEANGSPFEKSYQSLFNGKDHITTISSNISEYILEKYNKSFSEVSQKYLVGATLSKDSIICWFNGQPYHTIPLTLNLINRAILKASVGNDYDLTVSNKPYNMPINDTENHMIIYDNPVDAIFALVTIFMLFVYWPVIFIGSYVKERETRAKLLQYISGTNRFVYWLTSFFFDYVVFILICSAIISLIGIYQRNHFATFEELCVLFVISCSYAFGMLPFIYAFSLLFTKHTTAETMVSLFSILFGILYGVCKAVELGVEHNKLYTYFIKVFYWIGLFLAPFNLVDELKILGFSFLNQKSIFTFDNDTGIGKNITINIISGILFLSICLLKDHLIFESIYYKFFNRPRMLPLLNQNIDNDVDEEIQKVKEMSYDEIRQSNLVLQGLTKFYGNFLAVNQLYLDIKRKECFGLLGINGAGKTSTFKMMTGDELISAGDAYVSGFSMKNNLSKVHQHISYCPQFDAVISELTGQETLKIFSLIRGIPKHEINENLYRMATELGFQQHLKKQVKAFSGGNKRKLSTCLALLGNPQLIFLDEPTTGIDVEAKRKLWNVINQTRNAGRSIVITSHSIDECEALCTKIGIMVNGQFKCLGSVQHLKNKYSKGFVLTIKMLRDDPELKIQIEKRVAESFSSAELKEKYLCLLTFHITNTDLKWSEVFANCSRMKADLDISDYSLTQMSLEQVFILFSKSGIYQNQ